MATSPSCLVSPSMKIRGDIYLFIRIWRTTRVLDWPNGAYRTPKELHAVHGTHQQGSDSKIDIEYSPSSAAFAVAPLLNISRPAAYWWGLLSFSYVLRVEATPIARALQLNSSRRSVIGYVLHRSGRSFPHISRPFNRFVRHGSPRLVLIVDARPHSKYPLARSTELQRVRRKCRWPSRQNPV